MGVLARAAMLAALASCYSPDVKDCVLPCGSDADCAQGQSCSAESTCAAPSVTCNGDTAVDAQQMETAHDAAIDAPVGGTVPIDVTIDGQGSVMIGPQMCDGTMSSAQETKCTLSLTPAMMAMAMAMPKPGNYMFTRWTSLVCSTQGMSCQFTPYGPTALSVLFSKSN